MKVYIGADHRGFALKEFLKSWFTENNIAYEDKGASHYEQTDDYVDYASAVAKAVSEDTNHEKEARGIVICGSGFGVDFTANKIDGARSGIGFTEEQVKHGRTNDDINVLALASMFSDEESVKNMVKVFLETSFSGEDRHVRRLEKIKEIENS